MLDPLSYQEIAIATINFDYVLVNICSTFKYKRLLMPFLSPNFVWNNKAFAEKC
ncbi:hypothetical protein HYE20_00900 [Mycoplasmopsis bovis]|nr:hypothetical protein [Mycoplasmopsis bovis]QQH24520.1 hypothetical protein HYE20_00900 [Mycoplasmopsis bovis]